VVENLYADMIAALRLKYSPEPKWAHPSNAPEYIFLEEVRVGTGYKGDNEQRIDVWVMQATGGNMKLAFEIKTSRSDFRSEIKKPLKRRPGLRLSNKFYFYAPKGIIKPEEVPPECGLLEYDSTGTRDNQWSHNFVIKETVKAPMRDIFPPTWSFIASVHRNLLREQKKEGTNGKQS